jgi:hypothetical protein
MTSLSAIEIQALVRDMDTSFRKYRSLKEQNPQEWARKIKQENLKLFNDFPTIFNMHMNGKLDHTFFDMLGLKRKIEKGEMTEHEASVIIGQKLFQKYVDPVINNKPAERTLSYADYYKKSNENVNGLD